ncbi:hypothetical protein Mp_5g22740 [Marchantia polymorpha subsp. ruderalis]|uniref:Uncharacterized protein n=2 Tax=Marchantia polymorpha TaxID=3197 RepID=A0AAF6BL84_MARPO|nr:hypothetical protein MARPO_0010s0183 [Marchantia polymorpha]BBN12768.1 hypothetical protein Mp_5g22740 [Marchantia polymorpha subsp. ruderalis]|eukprot:PTQ46812.1 hypothetical protein MARPO_0010s0183 [Marchantia polymorpha]
MKQFSAQHADHVTCCRSCIEPGPHGTSRLVSPMSARPVCFCSGYPRTLLYPSLLPKGGEIAASGNSTVLQEVH